MTDVVFINSDTPSTQVDLANGILKVRGIQIPYLNIDRNGVSRKDYTAGAFHVVDITISAVTTGRTYSLVMIGPPNPDGSGMQVRTVKIQETIATTVAQLVTKFVDSINSNPDLNVTATSPSASVLRLTGKEKGRNFSIEKRDGFLPADTIAVNTTGSLPFGSGESLEGIVGSDGSIANADCSYHGFAIRYGIPKENLPFMHSAFEPRQLEVYVDKDNSPALLTKLSDVFKPSMGTFTTDNYLGIEIK